MLSYIFSPRINVDPLSLRDPRRFVPSVKGVVMFPESLENRFRFIDDFIIQHVQFLLNTVTMILAKWISEFYSVEVVSFIPYLLLYIGYDREVLHILSQSISLLILSQLPKRFMWRHRPYMVSRALIGSSDRTSSFPARTVGCGIVMTYMATIVFQNHHSPQGAFNLTVYYAIVTIAFVLIVMVTSFSRVILGAHYPSDCFVGTFQGILSCLLGNGLYYFMSCSKDLILANDVSNWTWDNVNYYHLLLLSVCGLILILVMGMRPFQLWTKSPLVAGILFPSIAFSHLLCPTEVGDIVLTLAKTEVFLQHFIVLTCVLAMAIFGYQYFKPRKLTEIISYFSVIYSCLLLLLMLQRLGSSTQAQIPLTV